MLRLLTSRNLDGNLGFTPLADGLAELGPDLCTAPDRGLTPPVASTWAVKWVAREAGT